MACQICLEDFDVVLSEGKETQGVRVQNLCHASNCTVDICSICLTTYITGILQDCVTGLLPRIQCPICLVRINKSKWINYVQGEGSTYVLDEYEALADKALAFEAPCCNEIDYTHLPEAGMSLAPIGDSLCKLNLYPLDADAALSFHELLCGFNDLTVETGHIVTFLTARIGNQSQVYSLVYNRVLPVLYDEERRASLLLAYLYKFPEIYTVCCDAVLCFNCKARHSGGEPCDDEDTGFSTEDCVVRCRQCRVMLVKTDGCDSVICLCGFDMTWPDEVKYRSMRKRLLLPVDLYDGECMAVFEQGAKMIQSELLPAYDTWRAKHVDRLISTNKQALNRLVTRSPWRSRRHQPTATAENS